MSSDPDAECELEKNANVLLDALPTGDGERVYVASMEPWGEGEREGVMMLKCVLGDISLVLGTKKGVIGHLLDDANMVDLL